MDDDIKGVILAAGKGTRLQPLTFAIPKEMVHVNGKALVEHAVELLKAGGVENFVVIVGDKKGALMDFLKDGKWLGVDVSYRFQEEQTGNATALYAARPLIGGTFVAMFGDEIIEPKHELVKRLLERHKREGAACTMGLSPVEDPQRYGIAKIDGNGRITELIEKPQTGEELRAVETDGRFLGSNGVFVFEPAVFDYIEKLKPGTKGEFWIADAIRGMVKAGEKCFAVVHDGIYRDVGTFEALLAVEKELLNNKFG